MCIEKQWKVAIKIMHDQKTIFPRWVDSNSRWVYLLLM